MFQIKVVAFQKIHLL